MHAWPRLEWAGRSARWTRRCAGDHGHAILLEVEDEADEWGSPVSENLQGLVVGEGGRERGGEDISHLELTGR